MTSPQKQSTRPESYKQYRMKFEWGDKKKEYAFPIYDTFSEWFLPLARKTAFQENQISKSPLRGRPPARSNVEIPNN